MIGKIDQSIHVVSLDFDGSINHRPRICEIKLLEALGSDPNQITSYVNANKPFIEQIRQEGQRHGKQIVLVGSNRQSLYTTEHSNRSCFKAIQQIANCLHAEMDPLLMADLEHGLQAGTSFGRIMDESYRSLHVPCLGDNNTKVMLLYGQIQYIANKYPNAQIQFDFFDDLSNILKYCAKYFRMSTDLIPKNVTVRLHHYHNAMPPQAPSYILVGTGSVNPDYVLCRRQLQQDLLAQNVTLKFDSPELSLEAVAAYCKFNRRFMNNILRAASTSSSAYRLFCATPALRSYVSERMRSVMAALVVHVRQNESGVPASQLGMFSASAAQKPTSTVAKADLNLIDSHRVDLEQIILAQSPLPAVKKSEGKPEVGPCCVLL
ncbi:MAG: hypothetical protein ACHP65_10515 [Legionellales bacterium]